jgi:uncharacterized protein YggU (UPF0235/DUF167 family)
VRQRAIMKITSDEVTVQVQNRCNTSQEEIIEFFGKILHVRLPQMSLLRGWSTRSKLLMVQGLTAQQVFERIEKSMEENKVRGGCKS